MGGGGGWFDWLALHISLSNLEFEDVRALGDWVVWHEADQPAIAQVLGSIWNGDSTRLCRYISRSEEDHT